MQFSSRTKEKLGFYVYALVDPRNNEIFYVGKASANNRAFDHLKSNNRESNKQTRINEIRNSGYEPKVEILRYGLDTENIAFEVEAAVIDSIGLENLTNNVRGHGIENGRILASEVERLHGSQPVNINQLKEPGMLFFIHKTYSPTLSEQEIYDCTRQFWFNVSKLKRSDTMLKTAFAVVDSVIIRTYTMEAWFPAGSTFSTRTTEDKDRRWEFVGNVINHELTGKMLVNNDGSSIIANQQGFTYLPRTS